METSESGNGDYSSSCMKYIEPPKLPCKYKRPFDELYYQSYFDNHPIPYDYQSDDNIDGSNHVVIRKIRNFSENTTAHGVRRIFIARNAYTARLWLFGIILCFIILIVQAYQLVMKFNRHEKITSIELKFDYIQFPAVTFCNLNPYKKSLVRSVPSVKDTMDVYENAKSFRRDKSRIKQQLPIGIIHRQSNKQKGRLSHLFDNKMTNDLNINYLENVKRRQRHLQNDLFKSNNHINTISQSNINHESANEINDEIFPTSNIHFVTDTATTTITITTTTDTTTITIDTATTSSTTIANTLTSIDDIETIVDVNNETATIIRSKRMVETMRYEAIEAHCKCIGKPDMECIRFESIPPSLDKRCICTYDNEMDIAWPCFNISIWYQEECHVCFETGFCEPKEDDQIPSANWPCLCRNLTINSVSFDF
ncbi:hypothetical protein LOAG_03749 [Loa loa]|uniref:Uncharacterized protein n=1 Tax=Loa loa TaxID=7209 RepID=A0A1S0U3F1_LOALO|nr:hypothetical protein LOAG_03749 [Loa loa]EFO24735.1 hypothetical protein LOAG_03749 [Loa loa]